MHAKATKRTKRKPALRPRLSNGLVRGLVRLPANRFTSENSADCNRVFLWAPAAEPPFMKPMGGWKLVGYGVPPWPKPDANVAVMFEKVTAAEPSDCLGGSELPEGSRIWQHAQGRWIPGHPEYAKWMASFR